MKRLVLAGGGHAHLHLLKSLAVRRWAEVEVILISPYWRQLYSGMVPGWIAGHYALEQCAAALEPLVKAAGARFVEDRVTAVDARRRVLRCATSGELSYDLLSLATGAEVDSSYLAATGAAVLPIRPLEEFVVGWNRQLEIFTQQGQARLAVVGGGAAGVELALAARFRLAKVLGAQRAGVHLVAGGGLLPGHGQGVRARVRRALEQHGINVVDGYAAGTPAGIQIKNGDEISVDCVLAATGVRPPGWLADSGLALSGDGFIAVADGQQSASHAEVFAAGDVASRLDAPHAKSGVYAVRAGPVLTANLARALAGLQPLPYQPQRRSLYLLASGPQQAIVSWGKLSASGHWAWRWKDWIDRRFMKQYAADAAAVFPEGEKNASKRNDR